MTIIEQEIMTQHEALNRTIGWFDRHAEMIRDLRNKPLKQIVFMGCGSSYMLARAGAAFFAMRTPLKSWAVAGGDFLIDPAAYRALLQDSLVVILTRSGQTSELTLSLPLIRSLSNATVLSLHTKSGSEIARQSDFGIALDWAFDHSVCQTRTITNFYTALAALTAVWTNDDQLMGSLKLAVADQQAFMQANRPVLEAVGRRDWQDAVVLADGELAGLAQEGALAFGEICIKPGVSYPLLDVRHGPAVLIGNKTLVLAVIRPQNVALAQDLIQDLKNKGATVISFSSLQEIKGADVHVRIPAYEDYIAWGIPMIYLPQMIALSRALADGHNPDVPEGLDPFITLKAH